MELINIRSAKKSNVAPNWLELEIEAVLWDSPDGLPEVCGYTYNPDEHVGLNPEITAWLMANPTFPIGPADQIPDPVPSDFTLTASQLRLGFVRSGISLSTIQSAIDGIADPVQRDEMQIYWEFSTHYQWKHEMTQSLVALVGMSLADAETMWLAAKDL